LTEKKTIYYELLVMRCQRGQTDAFRELVRTWEKRLFYYIRRLVDNEQDAWQVLQDTWLKVISNIKKLREPKKLPSWLYKIARNTALGHLRKKYKRQALIEPDTNILDVQDKESNFAFDDAQQVHYGLGKISLAHREALTLFFLQDLAVEEIAEVLQIPAGTVKSRLFHARQALRAVLEKEAENYE
jgi:RNA polymerase sigma factor (sigma-70 family)